MVGGRTASPLKTPAAYPGAKLAIAKVGQKDGTISGSMAAAVTWADTTVHADIISLSIGGIAPLPAGVYRDVYDAIHTARRHGILVTVANGNGFGNAGVPGDPPCGLDRRLTSVLLPQRQDAGGRHDRCPGRPGR